MRKLRRQTNPLLDELESSLILGHFQQLHGSPLVWSKTTHLADHVTNKLAVFGQTLHTGKIKVYSVYKIKKTQFPFYSDRRLIYIIKYFNSTSLLHKRLMKFCLKRLCAIEF